MAKASLTFAAWKAGRVAPSTGEVRVIDPPKNDQAPQQPKAEKPITTANLRMLGLALHTYHDARKTLPPPAIYSRDGKPLLSWRVAILPYLDHGDLYKQFKLDEPWNSDHNKKLVAKMPAVFAAAGVKEPGMTTFQAVTGPGTAFEGTKGIRFADIRDGLSNTLLLAEAADPVEWTRPADMVYDAKQPLPKFGGDRLAFSILMCDGSVRRLSRKIQEQVLRLLITRDDGAAVPDFELPK